MKKFFSIVLLSVLFSSVSFAQNWYASTSFGFDFSLNSGEAANQTINAQVGYFFDNNQAMEFDYSHGFQKDFIDYNRIGVNYVYEFDIPSEIAFAPYIKFGAAYKNIGFKDFHEEFADFKGGLGVHCYLSCNVSINFGVDFTNSVNDDISFEWRNTMMQMNIGLSYNF